MRARQLPTTPKGCDNMSTNNTGRSPRPKKKKKGVHAAFIVLGAVGAGLALPLATAGSASAATDSQWESVAQFEASGNWSINHSGDGLSVGGLQFQNASWQDSLAYLRSQGINTSSFPSSLYQGMSNVPNKAQQMLAGEALLHLQGRGAWVNGNGNALSASMFDGGPVPATVASSGLLAGTKWDTGSSTPSTPKPTTPPATTPKPSTPPATGSEKYIVKRGDTLSGIAAYKKVHGGWQALYRANKSVVGSNPNLIFPGQKLTVPRPIVKYVVKDGDTLSGIALKYKVTWQAIYNVNKSVIGSDPNVIKPGQVLTIPGGVSSSKPSTTPSKPSTPKPPASDNSTPTSNGWATPCAVMNITQVFGNPSAGYGLGYHTGIDITRPQGTPVRAVANATVVHSGYGFAGAAYGLHIVLKLPDGKYALYGHLSASTVRAGQTVSAGQMIGNVGSTGNSSGPHLHFEIRSTPDQYFNGGFFNPVSYLRGKGLTV